MRYTEMRQILSFVLIAFACVITAPVLPPAQADEGLLQRVYGGAHDQGIWMAEVTSKTLLRMGHVDFPLSVDLDLPLEAERADLGEILDFEAPGPRFAFVFDVQQAKATRRVVSLKGVPSTVFLGYIGNPVSVSSDDPAADLPEVQSLNARPSYTQSMGEPIIFVYEYDKAKVKARRVMSVTMYVIDRVERTYVKSHFDVNVEKEFEVAYAVSKHDPKRKSIQEQYDSEDDVDEFEKGVLDVKLSALFKDYLNKIDKTRPIRNPIALRKTLLQDRNTNLASVNANTFDDRALNDPRFDSVVVIYTGKRSMGTGFYVTPTIVMTNWHVVEDHPFVEMKTYDGQETFGTILGKDALLDIALVQVERRGRPVAFYTGKTLDLGLTVEAIGHPRRLEFSVTRGVISAIRHHHSINLPAWSGDEPLFIQTDAPINPGNSGGPLFLGNRVIGMNTWKRTDGEGMNFAVHYSELMNFMNEHLPGYSVSPAGPKEEAQR